MPLFSASQVPPPKNWQDFESLCWDLWRTIWNDPNAIKNGRSGQVQHGVDISGWPFPHSTWVGIQCKGKDNYADQIVTKEELEDEAGKAKKFTPKLSAFIVATSGPKDAVIEQRARELTVLHQKKGLFSVTVMGWGDIVGLLENYPDIIAKHYPWYHTIDWHAEASAAARYLWKHHFPAHRGAILWCPNVTAVFGNDGYDTKQNKPDETADDDRAKQEVELLRMKLQELRIQELGFGVDEGGYTWVVLVDSPKARELNELIWTCYPIGGLKLKIEKDTAWKSLHTYWSFPLREHCLRR
jgi:hypothetical protein